MIDANNKTIADLRLLKGGESMVYYVGFLDYDSDRNGEDAQATSELNDINMIADAAYAGYKAGWLLLTRRRLGPPLKNNEIDWHAGIGPGFAYIATRVRPANIA